MTNDLYSSKLESLYKFPQKCINKIRLWPCQLTQRLLATYATCSLLLLPAPVSCHQLELQLAKTAIPVKAAVDTHTKATQRGKFGPATLAPSTRRTLLSSVCLRSSVYVYVSLDIIISDF